jgi:3D (Asp-Asp-Asp) domain-containing protein
MQKTRLRTSSFVAGALLICVLLCSEACAGHLHPAPTAATPPGPRDAPLEFVATAYCVGTRTAIGTRVSPRTVAADPAVLPFGTMIRLTNLPKPYGGDYTVGDAGGNIRGRRVDLYIASCAAARRFGRRAVRVSVLTPD